MGKYFLITTNRIRPYVGFGLGYHSFSANYKKGADSSPDDEDSRKYNFTNEEYNTSRFMGMGLLGAEFGFTPTVGLNMEFRYLKSITGGLGSSRKKMPKPIRIKYDWNLLASLLKMLIICF